jgi:alkylation response protein AidB-like acyl-CoA dehydrogenase
MELEFTADQADLRDSIRAVLSKESPIARAREVAERGTGADHLWRIVTELGWPALTVPESFGGIGLGAVEAGILAEELGRVVAPGPLLATVTQFVPIVRALGTSAQQARWLTAVASGSCAATFGPDTDIALSFEADDVSLSGRARFVIEAGAADALALVVASDHGARVVVLERGEATIETIDSVDPTRQLAHVHLEAVRVPKDRVLGGDESTIDHTPEIRTAQLHGVSALALETVGVGQSIFDVAIDYARHREQFGVPIGSFQAIKHKFADMIVALERARATGYLAALCIAESDERAAITTSVAKAAAGDCQRKLAKEGIQILGGIGYTWEHDMHLYVKRAKANEVLLGTTAQHRARIADLLGV